MKDTIQIKTGANISALLQSTVNIPQAFTELVKNAIQNSATEVRINLLENSAVILDNGRGFDHETDPTTGMNDFEKYFVFGNSYQSDSNAVKLGHMGIGGKLANDKLSTYPNPHWSITTKNKHGKCFKVLYSPKDTEFLSDYSPTIEPQSADSISYPTGTRVEIHDLDQAISKDGWKTAAIRHELCTFFGVLVSQMKQDSKPFKLFLNDQSLDFDIKLPGYNFDTIHGKFNYNLDGKTHHAKIKFNLSVVEDWSIMEGHPVQEVNIASDVKICKLDFTDKKIFDEELKAVEKNVGEEIKNSTTIINKFSNLIGFINCSELSSVLDSTGMPAKDLSHHGLRTDHPITKPFYRCVYYKIIELLYKYVKYDMSQRNDRLDGMGKLLAEKLAALLKIDNDLLELGELVEVADGEEEDILLAKIKKEIEKGPRDENLNTPGRDSKESNNKKDHVPEEEAGDDKPVRWDEVKYKIQAPHIKHELIDFGPTEKHVMCRMKPSSDPVVQINTGNYKFETLEADEEDLAKNGLQLHIAEQMIKQCTVYTTPMSLKDDIDAVISAYYNKQ